MGQVPYPWEHSGQVGLDKQTNLVEDVFAHSRKVGLNDL